MNEFHVDVDLNKSFFKYEDPTKDVNFNEYYDSKEQIKNIEFDDAVKKVKRAFK